MIDGTGEYNFHDWLENIYHQIKSDVGVLIPTIQLLGSTEICPFEYQIHINDYLIGSFEFNPVESYYLVPKEHHEIFSKEYCFFEPVFGIGAIKEDSILSHKCQNFNKVSAYQILSTHLCQCLRESASPNKAINTDQ